MKGFAMFLQSQCGYARKLARLNAPGGLASAVEKVARVADQKALLTAPAGRDTTDRAAA